MDRVFLDANILFSAAYRESSSLLRLWRLPATVLLTSTYALQEALRNLGSVEQTQRLTQLLDELEIHPWTVSPSPTLMEIQLPANDQPIFQAAVDSRASHLLSGDRKAFGRYFGQTVHGILILRPADYLAQF